MKVVWGILAILCILYGFLILSLRSGTLFFAVWFALGVFFGVLALASRYHLWQKIPAAGRITALALIAACAAVFIFTEARIIREFGRTAEEDLDYLIVLGAQVRETGPSVVLQYRLDAAAAYLEENPDTHCIVSGGQGVNEPFPEAEGMRRYLEEKGIAPERILMEAESGSTEENIRNSMQLLDPETDRVGIVTNNFHVYRGCALAEKAGIRHVSGIAAPSKWLYFPNNMLREFFGVVKDKLAGHI